MRLSTTREMYDNLLDLEIETTKKERQEILNSLYKENDLTGRPTEQNTE